MTDQSSIIAGLNRQLTDALRAVIEAYGSQEDGHSGVMDKAIALARKALDQQSTREGSGST